MPTVVVVGAGLSGLACARFLADLLPDARVLLLEEGERAGGAAFTERLRGFTCEAGPAGFVNDQPAALGLALRCGLDGALVTGQELVRRHFVAEAGHLEPLPDGLRALLASPLLSWRGKARLLAEAWVPARAPGAGDVEETLGRLARRRFGPEAAELLVATPLAGWIAGDADRLSAADCPPHLARLEAEGQGLLGAMLGARRNRDAPSWWPLAASPRRLVAPRAGMGALADAVAESLGPSLRCGVAVDSVRRERERWVVETRSRLGDIVADAVVLAASGHRVASAARDLDAGLRGRLSSLPASPVVVLALGFREADVPHPLDGFGHVVRRRAPGPVLSVAWSSSTFPRHRAPDGHVLLQPVLGGPRDPGAVHRGDDELLDAACAHLRDVLGITAAPVLARAYRHHGGWPQREPGHAALLRDLDAALAGLPGLEVAGSAFRGLDVGSCVADAEEVAARVAAHVRGRRGVPPHGSRSRHPAPAG